MEALALVGGIIAVAQAGDRVIELLKKIRPLFSAPQNIDVLINEVSAFKSILEDLQKSMDHITTLPIQTGHTALHDNIVQARNVLNELEELIKHSFTSPEAPATSASRKIKRIAWAKKLHEVEDLRRRLRDVKINILVQLGAIQSMSHVALSQSIDGIARSVAVQLSEQADIQQSISRHFEVLSLQMATLFDNNTDKDYSVPEPPIPENTSSLAAGDIIPRPVQIPGLLTHLPALRALRIRVDQHYRCSKACPCLCHKRYRIETPRTVANLIGSIKFSWPTYKPQDICDRRACRSISRSLFNFEYHFPRWLLGRILYLSCFFSQQKRPELTLRVLQVRPMNSEIFRFVSENMVDQVHQMLTTGQASLFDVDANEQRSLLSRSLISPIAIDVVKYLILSGADLFQDELNGMTCFSSIWLELLAQDNSQSEFYQQIRPLVPDIDNSEAESLKTLHKIVLGLHGGSLETALLTTSLDIIDAKDFWDRTALMWAAIRGDARAVLLLLRAGADPNATNNESSSVLKLALLYGRVTCADLLIMHGADVTALDCWGQTPLHSLTNFYRDHDKLIESIDLCEDIRGADVEAFISKPEPERYIVKKLLDHGANINARSKIGFTPLMLAAMGVESAIVKYLLQEEADYQVLTEGNSSILHIAACYATKECLEIFRSHKLRGLRIDIVNFRGMTALDMAERRTDVDQEWFTAWQELIDSIIEADKDGRRDVAVGVQDMKHYDDTDGDDEIFADALEEFEISAKY